MKPPSVTMDMARARREQCLELLGALVTTESPTGHEAGNLAVAEILEDAMARAGGRVERHPAPGCGVHLLGRFGPATDGGPGRAEAPDSAQQPASGQARSAQQPLLVVGHMDTVHPVGTLGRLPHELRADRLYGPGVYDMKSGVAAALTALQVLAELRAGPPSSVNFLITCDEERGSPDSRPLIEAEARRSRAALVVEPSVPGGGIKSRRKGVGAYVMHVRGRAAHAGIEPEKGACAVHEIARQICRAHSLAAPAKGTTVSTGVVKGGTAENVVADAAQCTIDVRFWNAAEARRVDEAFKSATPFNDRCTISLEGGINRGALERTPESARLFEIARRAAGELGFELGEGSTGGGSDGNLTSAQGCPTLDGLGPDGAGAHTLHEHIIVSEIPRRIALMAALFEMV